VATFFLARTVLPNALVKLEKDMTGCSSKRYFKPCRLKKLGVDVTEPHRKTRSFFNFFSFRENAEYQQKSL
jgi:hypothetical protein